MRRPKSKAIQRTSRLLAAFCDGYLEDDERDELEAILRKDPAARRYYLRYLDLHQELARRADLEQLFPNASLIPIEDQARQRRQWLPAAAAAAVLLIGGLGFWKSSPNPQPNAQRPNVPEPANATEPVALVSRVENVRWEGPPNAPIEGTVLRATNLRLLEGTVRLEYFNGVAVTLQAPAEIEIDGPESLFLKEGQLAGLVPVDGPKFAVQTRDAVVYDLRAEFALNAMPSSATQVRVTEGELSAALLGEDGVPLHGQVLLAGTTIEMDPSTGEIQGCSVSEARFADMLSPTPKPLGITNAYVAAVRAAEPLAYWRFEAFQQGKILNEMGARYALIPYSGNLQLEGTTNKAVFLPPTDDQLGGLRTEEPFTGWTSHGEYTVELWMNPITDKWSSLASLVKPEEPSNALLVTSTDKDDQRKHNPHLMTLDCMPPGGSMPWMKNEPRAVRYYHRTCCRDLKERGAGLFSKDHYSPGQWHHVVVTCASDRLTLYLNGKEQREEKIETRLEEHPYLFVLGRFSRESKRFANLFSGRLDEVAFYDRALSANEVSAHFSLVEPLH